MERLAIGSLDVRDLQSAGALEGDWVHFPKASFRWPFVTKLSSARFMVRIEFQNQAALQNITVAWTRCNFGGSRPWLMCQCGQRVARLFKGLGGYCCRKCCGNPIYESQRRSKKARAYLRAYRARQKLDGSRPVTDAIPARPYGMRRTTYARLSGRIKRLELPLVGSRVLRRAPRYILPLSY